jgi:hypothetical protein
MMGGMVASGEVDRVGAAVRLLASADLATCGHRELDVLAGAVQAVRGFASSFEVRLARRRDEVIAAALAPAATAPDATPLAPADPSPRPSTVDGSPLELGGFTDGRDRRPGRECERDRHRAVVCAVVPMFEAALAEGRIDVAHVDAVASAWATLTADEREAFVGHGELLVGYAAVETPERFARRVRDLVRRLTRDAGQRLADRQRAARQIRRWIDTHTGMGHLHAELDPETTAAVWAALDGHLATLKARDPNTEVPLGRLEVDAFVELVTTSRALDPRSPEVCVHIDWATLQTGVFGAGSVCETSDGHPLTPEAVRRLACDANIIPIVLGGDGVPLDVGRTRRLATRDQRRALAAMYTTCAMPGCTVRFERCRIHHLDPWLPTGPTNLANLVPVCDRHHHLIHEGGWHLTMTPDRVITLRDPGGTIHHHGDTRDRTPSTTIADVTELLAAGDHPLDTSGAEHASPHEAPQLAGVGTATVTRRRVTVSGPPMTDMLLAAEPRRGP